MIYFVLFLCRPNVRVVSGDYILDDLGLGICFPHSKLDLAHSIKGQSASLAGRLSLPRAGQAQSVFPF